MRSGSPVPALRGRLITILAAALCAAVATARAAEPLPAMTAPDEPAPAALPRERVAAPAPGDPGGPGRRADVGPLGLPCSTRFSADPAAGGMALLSLDAPCLPDALVTITHGAVSASFRTSLSGMLETVFPAFDEDAAYRLILPGGEVLAASVRVPGAAGFERVVTMWQGAGGLSVHAYEYGSGAGAAGHVWRGAPRGPQAAEAGRGGFLTALGTEDGPEARRAEVYSFPAAAAARAGSVRIALAAAVTPATCGRALEAETLQIGAGLPGVPVGVRVALPDCGAASGDLMLKNLARDLKIAAVQ